MLFRMSVPVVVRGKPKLAKSEKIVFGVVEHSVNIPVLDETEFSLAAEVNGCRITSMETEKLEYYTHNGILYRDITEADGASYTTPFIKAAVSNGQVTRGYTFSQYGFNVPPFKAIETIIVQEMLRAKVNGELASIYPNSVVTTFRKTDNVVVSDNLLDMKISDMNVRDIERFTRLVDRESSQIMFMLTERGARMLMREKPPALKITMGQKKLQCELIMRNSDGGLGEESLKSEDANTNLGFIVSLSELDELRNASLRYEMEASDSRNFGEITVHDPEAMQINGATASINSILLTMICNFENSSGSYTNRANLLRLSEETISIFHAAISHLAKADFEVDGETAFDVVSRIMALPGDMREDFFGRADFERACSFVSAQMDRYEEETMGPAIKSGNNYGW